MANPPSGEPPLPRTPPRFVPTLTERVDTTRAPETRLGEAQHAVPRAEIPGGPTSAPDTTLQATPRSDTVAAPVPAELASPDTGLATPAYSTQRASSQSTANASGEAVGVNWSRQDAPTESRSSTSASAWRSDWITSFDRRKAKDGIKQPIPQSSVEWSPSEPIPSTTPALESTAESIGGHPTGGVVDRSTHSASDAATPAHMLRAGEPGATPIREVGLSDEAAPSASPCALSRSETDSGSGIGSGSGRGDLPSPAAAPHRTTPGDQETKPFSTAVGHYLSAGAASERDSLNAQIETPLKPEQAADFQELLVHRVLQRVDVALDKRMHLNIASVVEKHSRLMLAELREEVEGLVREAVIDALAAELAARNQKESDQGFH